MVDRRSIALLIAAGVLALAGAALIAGVQPLVSGGDTFGSVRDAGRILFAMAGAAAVVVLLRVDPAWSFSISIALMSFSGNWPQLGSPVALDRVVLVVGLVSLAIRAKSLRDFFGREPSVSHALIAIAALYGLASAIFSGTIGDHAASFALLDRYGLVPFALFAVAPAAFPDARSRRILLGCLTALGAYLVYTALLGRFGPRSLVFPDYIVDPTVGHHADRARGPFVEAGAMGMALFACGVAAVILSTQEVGRRVRLAALWVAAGCALCLVLTLTRSVWVGSAAGLVVAMLSARETRALLGPVLAAGVVSIAVMLAVVPGLAGDVNDRNADKRPIWDRENANAAAARMVAERPIIGFGWASFQAESADYQRLSDDHMITRADLEEHNVFLSNAVELGLLGTLLWAAALIVVVAGALFRRGPPELKWWRVGFVAIATQWFVVANFVPLGYALPNALLWLWAGILWSDAPRSAAAEGSSDGLELGPGKLSKQGRGSLATE